MVTEVRVTASPSAPRPVPVAVNRRALAQSIKRQREKRQTLTMRQDVDLANRLRGRFGGAVIR